MNTKDIIEFCFRYEKEIMHAVYERRHDAGSGKTGGSGSGHCFTSDTTAITAIKNIEELPSVVVEYGAALNGKREMFTLRHPERWLKVVSWTKEHYSKNKQGDLIKMKYAESRGRREICDTIGIGTSIYHVMLNDILSFAEGVAIGIGVLTPKH